MADDVLASLRPEGGWFTPVAGPGDAGEDLVLDLPAGHPLTGRSPVVQEPEAAQVTATTEVDDERWLLACVARGHVRWRGEITTRTASRSCAHTDDHADVTARVDTLLRAGLAQRSGTGVGEPCLYDACYRRTTCRVCGAGTSADAAPWVAGGGRVGQHYPLDPPRPWAPPPRVRIPAGAPADPEVPGQLTLGLADG